MAEVATILQILVAKAQKKASRKVPIRESLQTWLLLYIYIYIYIYIALKI